ncbi:NYN domain-containing protein [Inquilinus sp. CAU 1745]|uniref:NYN domain-containing protein n=1 Tax=Inquilinus sp. CAU 1745 TaxID=3140369 RepID=UPI00325AA95B
MRPPDPIRAVAFFDGQNLFHSAKAAFGYTYPNYDPSLLAQTICEGDEKGIDVRIALDVIRLAHEGAYDVALLFCRDQDLSEVAEEIKLIARERRRWIKIASAYPYSPAAKVRGINKTDWIQIDRATYDRCLDGRDYRPKSRQDG